MEKVDSVQNKEKKILIRNIESFLSQYECNKLNLIDISKEILEISEHCKLNRCSYDGYIKDEDIKLKIYIEKKYARCDEIMVINIKYDGFFKIFRMVI